MSGAVVTNEATETNHSITVKERNSLLMNDDTFEAKLLSRLAHSVNSVADLVS